MTAHREEHFGPVGRGATRVAAHGGGGRDDDGDAVMAKEAAAAVRRDPPPRLRPRRGGEPARLVRRRRLQRRPDARAGAARRDERGVDLVVFPELNISSYAVDDLFLQDAFLDAVEAGHRAAVRRRRAKLGTGARRRRAAPAQRPALQLRRWSIARGRILGVVPKSFLPNYREYYEKRWFASGIGLEGLDDRGRRPERAVRHRPDLRRRRTSPTSSSTSRFARIIGRRSRPRRSARWPAR